TVKSCDALTPECCPCAVSAADFYVVDPGDVAVLGTMCPAHVGRAHGPEDGDVTRIDDVEVRS
ncbi:hypothetical protein C6A85_08160, partial [Mycobacterium sp. ITM-2017-0098]